MEAYERGLERNPANFVALSPVSFLERAADVYPDKVAVVHGDLRYTYAQFRERVKRLASMLVARGVGRGDTVAVMAPNVPALLEAHYAVPGVGAMLNALNYRLDSRSIAFCLQHGGAKGLITDRELSGVVKGALARLDREIFVVDIDDALAVGGERLGSTDYESWIAAGDPSFELKDPEDEWDALALLYTSGTTGDPKGVVYHHRGAYLNALGNALLFGLT